MRYTKSPSNVSKIAILVGVGAMVMTPLAAHAQLDEIITTAQRREQNVQDVPLAVTAFSPKEMLAKQIDEPIDLIQYVPNLYGGNNTGLGTANVYYIRGAGNTESIATFDPPVGTYVDEIYLGRQNGNNIGFFDVEAIEVLRGPQGTLFGRNTTGGAIVTRMRKPSADGGGYVELGYGSYNRFVARASIDAPLSDTVLTKLSGYFVDDEGYVDNLATGEKLNGQEALGIRGDVRFLLSDTMQWDIAADYTEDSGTSILNYSRGGSPVTGITVSNDRVSNTGLSTAEGTGTLLEQALAGNGLGNQNKSFSATSNLQVDVGNGQMNFITGYRSLNQDFVLDFFDGGLGGNQFAFGGFTIANEGEHDQFSAELKYQNTYMDGALDIISGIYYFNEDNTTTFADIFGLDLGFDFPLLLANRTMTNTLNTYAAYVQGDYHMSDQLTLTLGARWTEEEKEAGYTDNTAANALNTAGINAAGIGTVLKKALVTPRAVLNYEWNDGVSTYVSATKGFKSGGWNARGTTADQIVPFGPEQVWNYEAGFRSVFANNTVSFNATAFFMDTQAVQTPAAFVVPSTGAIAFITQNFADLENKGVEMDLDFQPNEELTLYASFGYQDANYKNLPAIGLQQQADCVASPTNAGGGVGIIAPDCSVARPVRAPDYSLALGGSYDIEFGNGWNLTPSANVRFVGETFVGTANGAGGFEDGYTLVNAGVALSDDDSNWRAVIECKNCFNAAYITNLLAGTVYSNDPVRWHFGVRRNF